MKENFELAGHIGVDAGLCWVGDPCYIIHNEDDISSVIGKNWSEFCGKVTDKEVTQFPYTQGQEGLGLAISTGYGDGFYPVYVRKEHGRVMEISVVFDEGSQEEEEEEEIGRASCRERVSSPV